MRVLTLEHPEDFRLESAQIICAINKNVLMKITGTSEIHLRVRHLEKYFSSVTNAKKYLRDNYPLSREKEAELNGRSFTTKWTETNLTAL